MSLQNCHSLARIDFDYAYVDMEHGPLNLDGLAYCVAAMVDKAAALQKGNAQPKVALLARFPPYGRDLDSNDWIVKQALDLGVTLSVGVKLRSRRVVYVKRIGHV
jgi:2-keto-3-deoxy-L-rhamnonate aldolase RhmA